MSYHVSLTREKNSIPEAIDLQEWLAFVESSPDLDIDLPEGDDPVAKHTRSVFAARVKQSEVDWLGWSKGEVWTKNPSDSLMRYMLEVAPMFNARVRGDEGEFYRSLEDYYYEDDGREISPEEHRSKSNTLPRRIGSFFGRFGLTIAILTLFAILHYIVSLLSSPK